METKKCLPRREPQDKVHWHPYETLSWLFDRSP